MQRKKKPLFSKARGRDRRVRNVTCPHNVWLHRRLAKLRAVPAHNTRCSKCKMVPFCLQNNRPVRVTRCPRCNERTGIWYIACNNSEGFFHDRHTEVVSGIQRCPGKRADVEKCHGQNGGCKSIQAAKMAKYHEYLRTRSKVQDKTLE